MTSLDENYKSRLRLSGSMGEDSKHEMTYRRTGRTTQMLIEVIHRQERHTRVQAFGSIMQAKYIMESFIRILEFLGIPYEERRYSMRVEVKKFGGNAQTYHVEFVSSGHVIGRGCKDPKDLVTLRDEK